MLSRTDTEKRKGLVENHAHVGPQTGDGQVLDVVAAVDPYRPLGQRRRSAPPGGPPSTSPNRCGRTRATVSAGSHVQVEAVQHGRAVGGVAERVDRVEADVAPAVHQVGGAGAGRRPPAGYFVEDLVDAMSREADARWPIMP